MSLAAKRSLASFIVIMVCALPPAARAQDRDARQAIPALVASSVAAYNAGHPETMGKAYATDAIVMPPNGPAIRGGKAIADWWAGGWTAGLRNLALKPTEIYVEGKLATETGTYALDMPMAPGQPPVHDSGKYMVLWKRSPTAGWQLFRDIFNSDVTMPAMTTGAGGMEHESMAAGDSVWIVVNPVKADKRADYEQWVKEFGAAGARSTDAKVRRRFAAAHVIAPSAPSADGSWPYVMVLHPYYAGEDYTIASLTRKLVPASDTTRLEGLLSGARAAPPMIIRGTMLQH